MKKLLFALLALMCLAFPFSGMNPQQWREKLVFGLTQIASGHRVLPELSASEAQTILTSLTKSSKPAESPKITRTIEECQPARNQDWRYYCNMMWSQGMQIDCENANVRAKNEILDNLKSSKGSWQFGCING